MMTTGICSVKYKVQETQHEMDAGYQEVNITRDALPNTQTLPKNRQTSGNCLNLIFQDEKVCPAVMKVLHQVL